jgi:hypothetical protein
MLRADEPVRSTRGGHVASRRTRPVEDRWPCCEPTNPSGQRTLAMLRADGTARLTRGRHVAGLRWRPVRLPNGARALQSPWCRPTRPPGLPPKWCARVAVATLSGDETARSASQAVRLRCSGHRAGRPDHPVWLPSGAVALQSPWCRPTRPAGLPPKWCARVAVAMVSADKSGRCASGAVRWRRRGHVKVNHQARPAFRGRSVDCPRGAVSRRRHECARITGGGRCRH